MRPSRSLIGCHWQVQAADHSAGRDVQDVFGDAEDLLDRRVAAAADQDQPEAANVYDHGLLGDVAGPEQHAGQWRQDHHARGDHPGAGGRDDVGTRMVHRRGHVRWHSARFQWFPGEAERAAACCPDPADVIGMQVGDHHGVQGA